MGLTLLDQMQRVWRMAFRSDSSIASVQLCPPWPRKCWRVSVFIACCCWFKSCVFGLTNLASMDMNLMQSAALALAMLDMLRHNADWLFLQPSCQASPSFPQFGGHFCWNRKTVGATGKSERTTTLQSQRRKFKVIVFIWWERCGQERTDEGLSWCIGVGWECSLQVNGDLHRCRRHCTPALAVSVGHRLINLRPVFVGRVDLNFDFRTWSAVQVTQQCAFTTVATDFTRCNACLADV